MKTLYNNLPHVRLGVGNNPVQLSDRLEFKGTGTPLNRVLISYDNFHKTIFLIRISKVKQSRYRPGVAQRVPGS
jgi:hypothetical protein